MRYEAYTATSNSLGHTTERVWATGTTAEEAVAQAAAQGQRLPGQGYPDRADLRVRAVEDDSE